MIRPARRSTAWAVVAALLPAAARAADPPRRPNVIVIVSDDLGYNDLSCQGSPDIPTPHIDAIAKAGARFTNAYVTGPLCGPSRAGIMSGRYQERHSYDFMPGPDEGLSPKEATMGDAFRAAGYATAAVGKWNLGVRPQFRPLARGFDHFLGFLGALHPYVPGPVPTDVMMVGEHPRPGWGIPPDSANYEPPPKPDPVGKGATTKANASTTKPAIGAKAGTIVQGDREVKEPTYLTDAFTQDAVDFIDHHGAKPYFLYLAYNASHSPLEPPKRFVDRFPKLTGKRQLYAATTAALDDGVGRVMAEVAKLGQVSDTLVVFVNDNGGPITDTQASNAPLSGTKGSLWEGGIRVPFLIQWPGVVRPGQTRSDLAISLDIFPTVLAAANVPAPAGKHLEGVDLLPPSPASPNPSWPTARSTGGSATSGPSASTIGSWSCPSGAAPSCSCSTWPTTSPRTTTCCESTPTSSADSRPSGSGGTNRTCRRPTTPSGPPSTATPGRCRSRSSTGSRDNDT